ncbi:MAG: helix-turn-helix transcriptional regulator [Victivallales bacterium]|nr:helix-turn-helix transcriptional regulator [Victivallales bacterium]
MNLTLFPYKFNIDDDNKKALDNEKMPHIEKDIFPGLMTPPFHYACFTRFFGRNADCGFTVHNAFQIIIGIEKELHFELKDGSNIVSTPGSIFVLSPGIRHRWKSVSEGKCENFMFFCNGFEAHTSELGEFLNPKRNDFMWLFDMESEERDNYIRQFRELIREPGSCGAAIMHGLLYAFCGLICRNAAKIYPDAKRGDKHPALIRALEIISREYRKTPSLEHIARGCGLSSSRISELFRQSFGMSPMQYANDIKIRKAEQLLAHSDMNVSQIAEYLGFSSIHYFSRFYKKHTGTSPSDTIRIRR